VRLFFLIGQFSKWKKSWGETREIEKQRRRERGERE